MRCLFDYVISQMTYHYCYHKCSYGIDNRISHPSGGKADQYNERCQEVAHGMFCISHQEVALKGLPPPVFLSGDKEIDPHGYYDNPEAQVRYHQRLRAQELFSRLLEYLNACYKQEGGYPHCRHGLELLVAVMMCPIRRLRSQPYTYKTYDIGCPVE